MHQLTLFGIVTVLLAVSIPVGAARASEPVEAAHAMVVAAQHEASGVGRRILQAGGTAVDAAVAVGYALAVVDPCCGNIGGGGFMLIRRADATAIVINFREKAPAAASPAMFLDAAGNAIREASLYGYRAAGVPGTVMGLGRALEAYGRLGRAAVMAPAIALARDGFVLGPADAAILAARAPRLAADPEAAPLPFAAALLRFMCSYPSAAAFPVPLPSRAVRPFAAPAGPAAAGRPS